LRRKLDKFRIQVFALSILLSSGCLAYGLSDGRGNIYFPSPNLILENFCQDDLFLDPPDQLKAIPSNILSSGISGGLGLFFFKGCLPFFFQTYFFGQKEILRC